jgi:hypothetical protein
MTTYRERLWPAPWLYLATALVIPASLLVFLPIDLIVGIVVAAVLYGGIVIAMIASAPTIAVTETELLAGKARLPIGVIGELASFRAEEARQERGPRLDARAWLVIRGSVDPIVRIELDDPDDPTPYWIVSTRRPEQLIAALEAIRPRTPDTPGRASSRGRSANDASPGSTPRM